MQSSVNEWRLPAAGAPDSRARLLGRAIEAARAGNGAALMELLSQDVEYISEGGGKAAAALRVLRGPARIVQLFRRLGRGLDYQLINVNGELGVIVMMGEAIVSVIGCTTDRQRISGIYVMRSPRKLARFSPTIRRICHDP